MLFLATGQARHLNFCSCISDESITVQLSLLQLCSMGSGAEQGPAYSAKVCTVMFLAAVSFLHVI